MIRGRLLLALGSVLAFAVGVFAGWDHAYAGELQLPEPRVVYSCGFDFTLDICSMNADGTGEVMLTDDPSNDQDPEVSPSGQQVAWTKFSSEIWIMNTDGSGQRRIADFGAPAFAPTWSPAGAQLAFGCWMPGSPAQGICTANADGTGRQLAFESQGATQPDWSPNGSMIAFQSAAGQSSSDLYVLNLATSQVINVTNSDDADEYGPRWSPDGSQIAFWGEPLPSEQPGQGLFVMDSNGANRRKLLAPQFFSPPSSPAWSPDGSQLALICDHLPTPNRELCIVDVKSGDIVDTVEIAPNHQSEGWSEPFWATIGGTQQGDVDCNGSADTVDYLKILRYVAGLSATHASPCPEIGDDFGKSAPALWGDLDCNGTIDSVDALKGLRFVAALPVAQNEPCWDLGSIVVPV